jgi:DNA-binding MarR family transcriptional regulator
MTMPSSQRPGNTLPFLLLSAFRTLIDRLHERLGEVGHPDLRPTHGFALQMISRGGSVSDLGRRLGVSKQAASKTVTRLETLGYARRTPSRADQRRTEVVLTERGLDALTLSGEILDELREEWAANAGEANAALAEEALGRLGGRDGLWQIVGWLGS